MFSNPLAHCTSRLMDRNTFESIPPAVIVQHLCFSPPVKIAV